jgi:hypothetical protein
MAVIQNGGKRQFKLRLEKILKWRSFKLADLKIRLALIENNSPRHTVYQN